MGEISRASVAAMPLSALPRARSWLASHRRAWCSAYLVRLEVRARARARARDRVWLVVLRARQEREHAPRLSTPNMPCGSHG